MARVECIIADVVESELSDAGREVIEAAKRQSWLYRSLFVPKDGKFGVFLWDECPDSSDVLNVKVVSTISFRERCLKYGHDGVIVDMHRFFSHMGEHGHPIPTEEFIRIQERIQGSRMRPDTRSFSVSSDLIDKYWQGKITGAEVINRFSEEVRQFCSEGQWEFA